MTDIGISIKVSSDGSVTVKKNIDSIGQSAENTMAATDRMNKSLNSLKAPSLKTVANDFNSIGAAALANSARINSANVAFGKFGREAQSAAVETRTAMGSIADAVERVKASLSNFGANIGAGVQTAVSKLATVKNAILGVGRSVKTVGDASKGSSFNIANIAAQFQDIGVTAAMMQNPLQIALQQGTQLSAVFSSTGGGLGAVLKQLGAAFTQVLSPVSVLTIAAVALAAKGLQMVDWAKLAYNVLTPLATKAIELINILREYPAVLSVLGGAFAVVFGRAALQAVATLTFAIGNSLRGAIVGVFTLITANPITAVLVGVGALIGYVIEKTVGWKVVIQEVIDLWGKVVEVVGAATDALGLTSGLANRGLQIQVNAKQAAQDLLNAMNNGTNKLIGGLRTGKEWLYDATQAGGDDAGKSIKTAMHNGGVDAAGLIERGVKNSALTLAQIQKDAQVRAVQAYENMNGKIKTAITEGAVDGGKYIYNSITGAVTAATDTANKSTSATITTAGVTAGKSMGDAIQKAGATVTYNLSTAMSDVLAGFQQFGGDLLKTVNQMDAIVNAQIRQMQQQAELTAAQAKLANAQAQAAIMDAQTRKYESRNGSSSSSASVASSGGGGTYTSVNPRYTYDELRKGFSQGFNGGLRLHNGGQFYAGEFANGGRFNVGGDNSGRDKTPVAFRAERGERVTVETKRQQRANDNSKQETNVSVNPKIVNVIDPKLALDAVNTPAGSKAIVNVIKTNREEFKQVLGII